MKYPYTQQFRQNLVEWFHREQRNLPWRHTKDPYKIWVSEVMLQQTRVDTVIPYYQRFIDKYPTLESLAGADEEELLKMWEGLGYYSRARNLQAGVREVVEKYGGTVPNNRHDLQKLKGVGPYTAGAILSIAYNLPEHAVDGNVMRVLSRVLHITEDISLPRTRKIFEKAVDELIHPDYPGDFNQALMDLGAMICTPVSPKCLLCPVREYCLGFMEGDADQLPIKTKKTKSKNEYYDVYIAVNDGKILFERRPSEGLLANMWQFPMMPKKQPSENTWEPFELKYNVTITKVLEENFVEQKHVFSHLTWNMSCHLIEISENGPFPDSVQFVTLKEMEALPLPVPMAKIMNILNRYIFHSPE
ncbi:A/G-specific adenine glycosylase [Ureibacillus sp. FSL K6-8385]|uniref:Adenine DNA glycosylase n=1 Tax=Ureibacillus terrenus TaxID=118246 RepID=A0A540V340_9BACL|nr:A/G-specific adenine glycosylase [Ureibacillus terrenus]MED3763715.1 A/G-specific adenine glycosylase [Ureibacillus terrenus]TQE91159.1 A/G-specific adenine glycosylase [Ureibacillus terrenus]